MTHEEYLLTLQAVTPGALYCLAGTDYENILWEDSRPKPTQAELDAALPSATYAAQVQQVETTRRVQYEAQSDGLFFEWQRGTNTKEAWESAVQAVKDANPYPPAPPTKK
jgi:hypothetical protein